MLTLFAPAHGIKFTNLAYVLEKYLREAPEQIPEVELQTPSAWSCFNGVTRCADHCGCGAETGLVGKQHWRKPLRENLLNLQNTVEEHFERWARDQQIEDALRLRLGWIDVILKQQPLADFYKSLGLDALSDREKLRGSQWLMALYYCELMHTSCGWFFDDISRPETRQVLAYAVKVIELVRAADGPNLDSLLDPLRQLTSNYGHTTGAEILGSLRKRS
jgi:hypothetical protein